MPASKYLVYFISFMCLLHVKLCAQNQWTEEKTVENIKAYSRLKQGKTYYEYRTLFTVKAGFNQVKNIITDIENFKNWLPNTIDSRILSRLNDTVYHGYTVTEAPWPLSNRDVVFKVIHKKIKQKSYIIIMEGETNYYPVQKDKVRVQEYYASWKITEISPGNIEIDYSGSFDPGNSYPNWVVKNALIDARINASQKLIEALKKR